MKLGLQSKLEQKQEQKQKLTMTPKLQQAIKLLQLSRMELISEVRQEFQENPMLEKARDPYEAESMYRQDHGIEESEPDDTTDEVQGDEGDMDNIDWEEYVDKYSSRPMPTNHYKGYSTSDLPGYEQTLESSHSLIEDLTRQIRLSALDEDEEYIATLIVGNLDKKGYFNQATVEDIAEEADATVETVEEVLAVVQSMDPLAIASRDLQECLNIQAEEYYPDDEVMHQMLDEHISDLERKSFSKIARSIGVDKEVVHEAAERIATLEPKPGRGYVEEEANYVTPDIYIREDGDDFRVVLNEDGLPKLKISNFYKKELERKKEEGEDDEAKDYIQEKLRGAMWLIRSIHQRQSTIVKVTKSILKFQRDFFEKGVEHLKPLVLKEVADDIEMHESTVSRVTTNKYVHTPRGVYELKFFFNSSISREGGEDLASEAVKAKIAGIIEREDPANPLSDSKIADKLDEDGIDIARRTVAKYRESMGVLSSTKRKQPF